MVLREVLSPRLPEGFELHAFEALAPALLYEILALRQAVFIVEQACPFQDADGRDAQALHLVHRPGLDPAPIDAYARLFVPTPAKPRASFGRVITAPRARRQGLGHRVVDVALDVLAELAPGADVHISAQAHLDAWYSKHRFEVVGAPYMDDGILHLDMVRRWSNPGSR